jgi:hypothetical protein
VTDQAGETELLARLFRVFGATQCRGRSPVYERLSEQIATDAALLHLLLTAPAQQRRPSLLFASVNALLARDCAAEGAQSAEGAELAAYYPTHGGTRLADAGLWSAFRAFCAGHEDELGRLLREGSTQTNEIRRCVALRLGLGQVRRHWTGPVALAEIGASAGLNLLFDRYEYRLGDRGPAPVPRYSSSGFSGGSDAGAVVIGCDVRGGGRADRILGAAPEITSRIGIDQEPVDLADPDARAWLEAFVWPEQTGDLATLRAAVSLATDTPGPAVVRGDATTDTARLIGGLPGDEPVVVFTASLLSYLDARARTAFADQLARAARKRPIAWVFAEGPGLLATTGLALPVLEGPLARRNTMYAIGASLREPGGRRDDALLGLADPYLRWLAPARDPEDDFGWVSDHAA